MSTDETPVWQLSAAELADQIRTRKVSVVAAVTQTVERMRAVNPRLNAVVDDMGDIAVEQAHQHDAILAAKGQTGPLFGVPVTIKENIDQRGRATPNGVVAFKDVIAPGDAPVVRNLQRAGAIVIGRTNTPEFSYRGTTVNELHGRTLSPWNDTASSGGSSGGASTAVMSGMGALAHGNDIAGSLRYPAAATGAATVKPGLGRTPAYNPSAAAERGPLSQIMSVQGVIGREVRDVRLGMQALVHYDAHDPWMVPMPFEGPQISTPIKVAYTKEMLEFELHPAVDKALDAARDALTDAGYELVEAPPPLFKELANDGIRTLLGEAKTLMEDDIRRYGSESFQQIFDEYMRYYDPYQGKELLLGMSRRAHYTRQWLLFLEQYPLYLTPFLPAPTYDWDRDTQGQEGVREVLGAGIYSATMNYMGLPAGNIPASYNDGLPVGVQIVGRRFREDLILDACEAIEQRIGLMSERLFARETAG